MICYYKILGISVKASQEEIKRAFRSLALRWHPDRNPRDVSSVKRFREVLEAYETLIDPIKRNRYDNVRGYEYPKERVRSYSYHGGNNGDVSYEKVLSELFGISLNHLKMHRGNDLRFDLQVPRKALGKEVHEWIQYHRLVYCRECSGNGKVRPRSSCEECDGAGEVEEHCSLYVRIPPHSRHYSRLRISGAGDQPVPGIPPGDLIIVLHVINRP